LIYVEAHHKKLRAQGADMHTQVVGSVENIKACSQIAVPSDFWVDPNSGNSKFSVEVWGDFSDLEPQPNSPGSKPKPKPRTPEELYQLVQSLLPLYSRPFVVVRVYPERAVFLRRDLEWRAFQLRQRIVEIFDWIPPSWVSIRGGYSRHIVVTVTVPRSLPLYEAWDRIDGYFRDIVRYFDRMYGVRGYVGVYEVHRDGYPHIHAIIFVRRRLRVFRYRGVLRFRDKKRRWERDLNTQQRGHIDCLALRGGKRGALRYFSKYLSKFGEGESSRGLNLKQVLNLKPYSLVIFRLFRKQPIKASRNLRTPRTGSSGKLSEGRLRKLLREVGEIALTVPRDLVEYARLKRELRVRLDYISQFLSTNQWVSEVYSILELRAVEAFVSGDLGAFLSLAKRVYLETPIAVVSLGRVIILGSGGS
jgi:hypothetical protein